MTRQRKDPQLKVVKELIDETPTRVRKNAAVDNAYMAGVTQGRRDAGEGYREALDNMLKQVRASEERAEAQALQFKHAQISLVQTFAQTIFMLGKEEGKPKRTDEGAKNA